LLNVGEFCVASLPRDTHAFLDWQPARQHLLHHLGALRFFLSCRFICLSCRCRLCARALNESCVLFEGLEKVGELEIGDLSRGDVTTASLYEGPSQIFFEALQVHDLVFDSVAHNESVDYNSAHLADTVGPVHSLQIVHRVPIVLGEDHNIGACQRQAQTAHRSRQDQHSHGLIMIELIDDLEALFG